MFCPINLKDIQNIKNKTSEPFYYYDGDMIKLISENLISSFSKYFRGFRNFYKVRDLNNKSILDILFYSGIDFDVTTTKELDVIQNMGVLPRHMMFTSNFTSKKDLEYVYNNQVNINLDSINEVDIFNEARIKFDNKLIVHDNIICFNYNPEIKVNNNVVNKFGMSTEEIIKAYKKAFDMGYNTFGIKCINEYGMNYYDNNYYDILFGKIFHIINELKKSNIIFDFINLGEIFDITDETPQNLRKLFDKYIEIYEIDDEPIIHTECTSHLTKKYCWLITECNSIKKNKHIKFIETDEVKDKDEDKNENEKMIISKEFTEIIYGLNADMTNLFQKFNNIVNISVFGKKTDNKVIATIVGNTYNYNDFYSNNINISEINIEDIVILNNLGINMNYPVYPQYLKYNKHIRDITINNNKNYDDNTEYIIWIVNVIILYIVGILFFTNFV
jgi:diaminopimelate decarboxylase